MVNPTDLTRRSFLYRKLTESGANFTTLLDCAVAADFGNPEGEVAVARSMGIVDLSPVPRWGLKGAGGPEWLAAQGVAVPREFNKVALQDSGELAARLSAGEVLILGDPSSDSAGLPVSLAEQWESEALPPTEPRGFPLPRQETYCWLLITGERAPEMFAKICAVDLRTDKFPVFSVAQTSVARTNGIVIRSDIGATPAYHVVFDSASADYMWVCLLDAMEEFDGGVVGLSALRSL